MPAIVLPDLPLAPASELQRLLLHLFDTADFSVVVPICDLLQEQGRQTDLTLFQQVLLGKWAENCHLGHRRQREFHEVACPLIDLFFTDLFGTQALVQAAQAGVPTVRPTQVFVGRGFVPRLTYTAAEDIPKGTVCVEEKGLVYIHRNGLRVDYVRNWTPPEN